MKTTITNETDESSETQQMAMVVRNSNRVSIEASDDSPAANEPLTDEEDALFTKCKTTIKANKKAFIETGEALATIRNQRLYRATHSTFEKFVRSEFEFSRSYAYKIMDASEVEQNLCTIVHKPLNEGQARALVSVPKEKQAEVMKLAVEHADGKPLTAKLLKQAAEVVSPETAKKQPATEPEPENKVIVMPTVQSSEFDELLRWVRTAIQYLRQPDPETLDAVAWLTKIEDKLESLVAGESERRAG